MGQRVCMCASVAPTRAGNFTVRLTVRDDPGERSVADATESYRGGTPLRPVVGLPRVGAAFRVGRSSPGIWLAFSVGLTAVCCGLQLAVVGICLYSARREISEEVHGF